MLLLLQVADLVSRYPRALTYSRARNLEPKLSYLRDRMHFTTHELAREVFDYPLILGYSLEKRIQLRHEHLIQCKILVRARPPSTPATQASEVVGSDDQDGKKPRGHGDEEGPLALTLRGGEGRRRRQRGKAAVGGADTDKQGSERAIALRSMLSKSYTCMHERGREGEGERGREGGRARTRETCGRVRERDVCKSECECECECECVHEWACVRVR